MADYYVGEIRPFACNYAPDGWLACDGATLRISQYNTLYSVIGTTYGGNGTTTFMLPDLRNRAVVGAGTGTGLSKTYVCGAAQGADTITLVESQSVVHTHTVALSIPKKFTDSASAPAAGSFLEPACTSSNSGTSYTMLHGFTDGTATATQTTLDATTVATAYGNSAGIAYAHENRQPSQAVMFCIAINGTVPVSAG